ncbi:hypothetical protein SteCoe_22244 [Stentor coeruleus]|uniref:Uncharacterized protein n=1 Tax=Stentor coeruleus TaxID=5963 RepID=A0A1R2BMN4_9CILI|nr:hypothetical protein SteCoe_22244 [Stentor coeruleus]
MRVSIAFAKGFRQNLSMYQAILEAEQERIEKQRREYLINISQQEKTPPVEEPKVVVKPKKSYDKHVSRLSKAVNNPVKPLVFQPKQRVLIPGKDLSGEIQTLRNQANETIKSMKETMEAQCLAINAAEAQVNNLEAKIKAQDVRNPITFNR